MPATTTKARAARRRSARGRGINAPKDGGGSGDDPALADPLLNLAALYIAERRFAETAPLYKRAIALREKAFGPDHPQLAKTLANYAAVLRKIEDYAEAEKVQVRATGIRVRMALHAADASQK